MQVISERYIFRGEVCVRFVDCESCLQEPSCGWCDDRINNDEGYRVENMDIIFFFYLVSRQAPITKVVCQRDGFIRKEFSKNVKGGSMRLTIKLMEKLREIGRYSAVPLNRL